MVSLADSNSCPHDQFFFSDGSLYLSVENTLYCVHRFLFEIHADMFPARDLETSLSNPYVLGDVKKSDFDCLLASLYPRTLWVEEAKTTQEWVSILELASKWGFRSLRSRAISKIEETVESPIDMVTLGRQYGIPNILLPGYAILCQSTVPLSDEEGHRLGMEDVLNIYRIRHELGSGIAPISFEVAFAKVKEAGLGVERPRQDFGSEGASTWTDAVSVATSQISEESDSLTSNVEFSSLEVSSTEANLILARAERRHINADSCCDNPTSVVLGNKDNNTPSFIHLGNVSKPNAGPLGTDREGFKLLDELTTKNYDLVSIEIMQWVNTTDIQTLHEIAQLTLERAIDQHSESHPCVRLCKAMIKHTQTLHQVTRLIVEKVMNEPHGYNACVYLCNNMVLDKHGNATADGKVFSEYLGELCKENLVAIAASATTAGEHMTRVRRQRLIGFIDNLSRMWTREIIDKWITALLDVDDEEKVATLFMLMTRVGRLGEERNLYSWLHSWLQRMTNAAQEASNPQVRTILLSMKKLRERDWIMESTEDCSLQ